MKAKWSRHFTLKNREKDRGNIVASDAVLKNNHEEQIMSTPKKVF